MSTRKTGLFQVSHIALIAIAHAVTNAVIAFGGWVFDLEILKTISFYGSGMMFNMALGILFSGLSLLLFCAGTNKPRVFLFALLFFERRRFSE